MDASAGHPVSSGLPAPAQTCGSSLGLQLRHQARIGLGGEQVFLFVSLEGEGGFAHAYAPKYSARSSALRCSI